MIRNIRHIQIRKVAYHPNLFKAVITFEKPTIDYDESDDIEYIKLRDLEKQKKDFVKFKFGGVCATRPLIRIDIVRFKLW